MLKLLYRYFTGAEEGELLRPYWERLLRQTARKRNVVELKELRRQADLHELCEACSLDPKEVLSRLLSGEEVEFDLFDEKNSKLFEKMLKIAKEENKARRSGKRLLHLAFPFLQVEEVGVNGPVTLYPLGISIDTKRRRVRLRREGDAIVNELLFVFIEKKMKRGLDEEGLERLKRLPSDPEEAVEKVAQVLEEYLPLNEVEGLTRFGRPRGVALRGIAVIGIFDVFPKYVLKDLSELMKMEDLKGLEKLLDQSYKEPPGPFERLKEEERLYPLPYDESQDEAISAAVKGPWRVVVLQGPPGTGKSQTVANLVAQLASMKKKVLVVCWKKAALDVLKKRLEAAGVASVYVWDSTDKRKAYSDLADALSGRPEPPPDAYSKKIEELKRKMELVRKELTKKRECGLSLIELYSISSKEKAVIDLSVKDSMLSIKFDEFQALLAKLKEVEGVKDGPVRKDWSGASLYERDLALKALNELKFMDVNDLKDLVKAIKASPSGMGEEELKEASEELRRLLALLSAWRGEFDLNFELVDTYFEKKGSVFKSLSPSFRKAKAYVERVLEEQGLREVDLFVLVNLIRKYAFTSFTKEELLKEVEERLERVEAERAALRLSRKYGDALRKIEEGSVKALDSLFYLEKARSFEEMEEMLNNFEKLRYVDLMKRELDNKGRAILRFVIEHGTERALHTYAYFWISEIERMPEVSKAIALMKDYNKMLEEYKESIKKKLEWAREKVAKESREEDELLAEEVEKARKRGTSLATFVRPRAEELVEKAKVWLLSPEAVSELFPLLPNLFDYVIIDEASQMGVEFALPALYRARKAVIVGDEKQLPPSLLTSQQEGPESVLELVRGRFPSFMLRTHYRSLYEELIAFSNYAFYDGKISYAPNPEASKPFEYLKVDGLWEDGTNAVEAKAVVEKVKELLKENPERSIGIIAFNRKQRDLIISMLEREARMDKEFAILYEKALNLKKDGVDQSLVVENIENIQGEERDVIIFSLVHARDKEGKLHVHFGSLNLPGGERRLNVAITRARERVVFVTSLEPEELGEPKSAGPKLLKEYMKYVKYVSEGEVELAKGVLSSLGRAEVVKLSGPVERRLKEFLPLELDWGTSRFGVPARFKDVAVESDESVFRLTEGPLDEAVRDELLRSKGWKVVRVWSREVWEGKDVKALLDASVRRSTSGGPR